MISTECSKLGMLNDFSHLWEALFWKTEIFLMFFVVFAKLASLLKNLFCLPRTAYRMKIQQNVQNTSFGCNFRIELSIELYN